MSAYRHPEAGRTYAEALLGRMKTGDRQAVAEFVVRYGDLIRLRIRDKIGPRLRRVLDSEDVLSTVTRRLDGLVRDGAIRAGTNAEFWSLISAIANHAVSENIRALKRECNTVEGWPEASDQPDKSVPVDDPTEEQRALADIVESLHDETDRRVLWMRLHDHPHETIASEIGASPAAVRMRWSRIRKALRQIIQR